MNVAQIRKYDTANGPGIRTTAFFSGCNHKCKGCFNERYQDFEYGVPFTQEIEDLLIEYLKETKRLSVLGGEPMQQGPKLVNFLRRVKNETDASIWMWTGYTIGQIFYHGDSFQKEMLQYVDVLVDGPFVESKKDLTLKFRGSSNQRIIDVQETKRTNKLKK